MEVVMRTERLRVSENWEETLKASDIDYSGCETLTALPLTLRELAPAVPPPESCGILDAFKYQIDLILSSQEYLCSEKEKSIEWFAENCASDWSLSSF